MGSQVAAWEVVGRMFGYLVSVFVLVNTAILKGDVIQLEVVNQDLDPINDCTIDTPLVMRLTSSNLTVTLSLRYNPHINMNSPVYVIEDGDLLKKLDYISFYDSHTTRAYQSVEHGASVVVTCVGNVDGVVQHHVEGLFRHEGKQYRLQPDTRRQHRDTPIHRVTEHSHTFPSDPSPGAQSALRELPTSAEKVERRTKRDTKLSDVYIDIVIVTDYAVYTYWKKRSDNNKSLTVINIRKYFAHMFNGADLRFQGMTGSSYNIHIRQIGYVVSTSPKTSSWTELNKYRNGSVVMVNAKTALDAFRTWLADNTELPAYDHAMLFTGYDLASEDSGYRFNVTTGLAFFGRMCKDDGSSSSVVEDRGAFQSVRTIAHELGHSLGANHDNAVKLCSAGDRYIMSPAFGGKETEENKLNPFHFSKCSISEMSEFIKNISQTQSSLACLRDKLPQDESVIDVSGEIPGQLVQPDRQCKQYFGDESYMCRGPNFPIDEICRSLFCSKPDDGLTCVEITSARGTTCGNKKWCMNGKCIEDEKAPPRPESCPLGEHPGILQGGKTCKELVDGRIFSCYDDNFRTRCCESCIIRDIPDCAYGDKQNGCVLQACSDKTLRSTCCETCYNIPINTSPTSTSSTPTTATTSISATPTTTTESVSAPTRECSDVQIVGGEEKNCSDYLRYWGKSKCYDGTVYNQCCTTCTELRNETFQDCPWGDTEPYSCYPLRNLPRGFVCLRNTQRLCCETCGHYLLTPPPSVTNLSNEMNSPVTQSVSSKILIILESAAALVLLLAI